MNAPARTPLPPGLRAIVLATLLFFLAFGLSLPVLPLFVLGPLAGSELAVSVAFGAYAVAAVLIRPLIGFAGDARGRRFLMLAGGLLTALGMAGHLVATTVTLLVVARAIVGIGQAAVMVGATTLAIDLAPPGRQGAAASYVLVAVQVGMGTGPLIGEWLLRLGDFDTVWIVAGILSVGSTAIALRLREPPRRLGVTRGALVHPDALGAGTVVCLGALGFGGFMAFAPLYAGELGIQRVGVAFLLLSGTIAVVRLLLADLPDRLGGRRCARIALSLVAAGLTAIGLAPSALVFYLATMLLGSGSALLVPSMTLIAVERSDGTDRARIVATFTVFLDIAMALGPGVFGVVSAGGSYGSAFLVAASTAALGLALLRPLTGQEGRTRPGG